MVFPVGTKEQCDEILHSVRRQHPNARHVCYAYRLGTDAVFERMSDDGEPGGTAGAQMLTVLRGRKLTNVLAVVVRYFGGILLGTGGLTRAYSSAISGAVEGAEVVPIVKFEEWSIEYVYPLHDRVMFLLQKHCAEDVEAEFGERVTVSARVPTEGWEKFVREMNEILCSF